MAYSKCIYDKIEETFCDEAFWDPLWGSQKLKEKKILHIFF